MRQLKKICSAYNQEWDAPTIIFACVFPKRAWVRDDKEEYWKANTTVAKYLIYAGVHRRFRNLLDSYILKKRK